MLRRDGFCLLIALTALLFGCRSDSNPQFPQILEEFRTADPNPGFDLYVLAAQQTLEGAEKQINRVTWTPGQRVAGIKGTQKAVSTLRKAHLSQVEFVFSPHSIVSPPIERRGWWFLGKTLQWRIEDALKQKNGRLAVGHFSTALRFGLDLTGGDVTDAGLGLTIAVEGTRALWPSFFELPAEDLARIFNVVRKHLENAPGIHNTLRNENATILRGIQFVLDCYTEKDLKKIVQIFGESVEPTVRYLQNLFQQSPNEQSAFFKGFVKEAHDQTKSLNAIAARPMEEWREIETPSGTRPWKRIAMHLLTPAKLYLENYRRSQTLLRLLAVDAALMARFKRTRSVPPDLSDLPSWIRTDPYSGKDFIYIPASGDYKVYSVGQDGIDNGGDPAIAGPNADITPLR